MTLTVTAGGDSDKKKAAHQTALNALTAAQRSLADEESALQKLFNPTDGFGKHGEWKKLDGTCIEKESGECVNFGNFYPSTGDLHLT